MWDVIIHSPSHCSKPKEDFSSPFEHKERYFVECSCCSFPFKRIVHPKLKIVLSFTHPQVVPNLYNFYLFFFCWIQKKIFWRMWVTKQLTVATDFLSIFSILWKSLATVNCTGLKQHENERWWQNFHFWLNYPFKACLLNPSMGSGVPKLLVELPFFSSKMAE